MIIKDEISPELERIREELTRLSGMKIHVGIQGAGGYDREGQMQSGTPADILTIANVHEFGATIKAKNVKNLAIPISKKAIGKSPRDFENLFFLESDGLVYGCIDNEEHESGPSGKPRELKPQKHKPADKKTKKKRKKNIEFLFILMESTTIPERSFIRAGYDNNRAAIEDVAAKAIQRIIFEGANAEMAAHYIGVSVVGMIWEYMTQPFNFKGKGNITKATSNSPDNPLFETGRLRNSVTYRIEE